MSERAREALEGIKFVEIHTRHLFYALEAAGEARRKRIEPGAVNITKHESRFYDIYLATRATSKGLTVSYAAQREDGSWYAMRSCPFDGVPGY